MRKFLFFLSIFIVACILTAPSILAAKIKPPKNICYDVAGSPTLDGSKIAMAIKKSGTKIRDANTSKIFYAIDGVVITAPGEFSYRIAGTGLWDSFHGRFEGNVNGLINSSGSSCLFRIMHETETDYLRCRHANSPGVFLGEYDLTAVDCRSLDIH